MAGIYKDSENIVDGTKTKPLIVNKFSLFESSAAETKLASWKDHSIFYLRTEFNSLDVPAPRELLLIWIQPHKSHARGALELLKHHLVLSFACVAWACAHSFLPPPPHSSHPPSPILHPADKFVQFHPLFLLKVPIRSCLATVDVRICDWIHQGMWGFTSKGDPRETRAHTRWTWMLVQPRHPRTVPRQMLPWHCSNSLKWRHCLKAIVPQNLTPACSV